MFLRLINPIKSNSFFLFGARGTGKSTFLRGFIDEQSALWVDLLLPEVEARYALTPSALSAELRALREQSRAPTWVVIDEVQKLPKLLDVVHSEIENHGTRFALTGSSARKLRHGAANLLAGRAFVNHLYPLTHGEVGAAFDLHAAFEWGTLPKVYQLTEAREKAAFLRAYAQTYLKEEVWGEHLIRDLDPFRRFLPIAAQSNGQILNYTNIARDVGVDPKTVQNYFEILIDTLIGFRLPAFARSLRKQQNMAAKFYFFDLGVQRALAGILNVPAVPQTYAYGKAFEHFVLLECHRLNDYLERDLRFSYLRTKDDAEIDLVVEEPNGNVTFIEIKSTSSIDDRATGTLESFLPSISGSRALCLSQDPRAKKIGNVLCLPWQEGLRMLGLASAI